MWPPSILREGRREEPHGSRLFTRACRDRVSVFQLKKSRFRSVTRRKFFPVTLMKKQVRWQDLEHVPGNIQGWGGSSSEQPGLADGVPAVGRGAAEGRQREPSRAPPPPATPGCVRPGPRAAAASAARSLPRAAPSRQPSRRKRLTTTTNTGGGGGRPRQGSPAPRGPQPAPPSRLSPLAASPRSAAGPAEALRAPAEPPGPAARRGGRRAATGAG